MATKEELEKKIDKFEVNMTRTDRIVNGTENEDVRVDDGQLVPSIRKWQKELEEEYGVPAELAVRAETAAGEAEEAASRAADETVERLQGRIEDVIQNSGYQFVGDYAAGVELTEYNQLVRDENGEFWRVSGQVDLPYVTTGAGVPEDDALVPAGDAVVRQDLANPNKGAAMVARGVVAVDSIADLLALPAGQRKEGLRYLVAGYHGGWAAETPYVGPRGGGEFYWDSTRAAENDGGSVIGGWVRIVKDHLTPEMFGARGDGVTDDHMAIQSALNAAAFLTRRVKLSATRYLVTDEISWPWDGDNAFYNIALSGATEGNGYDSPPRDGSSIRFTGGGALINIRIPESPRVRFTGSITDVVLYGPGRESGTTGILSGDVTSALFRNVKIRDFGKAFHLHGYAYYSNFERCVFRSSEWGFYTSNALFNNSFFKECVFTANSNHGFYRDSETSDHLGFRNCYFEANWGSGFYSRGYFISASFDGCYFEGNSVADIDIISLPWRDSVLNVTRNTFDAGGVRPAVKAERVGIVNSKGNTFNSIGSIPLMLQTGILLYSEGDRNNTGQALTNAASNSSKIIARSPTLPDMFFTDRTAPPNYINNHNRGDIIRSTSASAPGDVLEWTVTVPGKGPLASQLVNYTGDVELGSRILYIKGGSVAALKNGLTLQLTDGEGVITFSGTPYCQIRRVDLAGSYVEVDAPADRSTQDATLLLNEASFVPTQHIGDNRFKAISVANGATRKMFDSAMVSGGFVCVTSNKGTDYSGILVFNGTPQQVAVIAGGASLKAGTGVPTGSTGEDGDLTIFWDAVDGIYVENRTGGTVRVGAKLVAIL